VGQLAVHLDGPSDRLPRARVAVVPHATPSSLPHSVATSEPVGLRLYCLGPFEIYFGDDLLPLRRMSKGRTILKFLASRPRQPVFRDTLLETLWPDEDPDVANNRLKVAMH